VGSVSFSDIRSPKVEIFYWITILFSNTLGTALGDFLADTSGVGYERGALVFAGALTLVAAGYFFTRISHTLLFWTAFILTRPEARPSATCLPSRGRMADSISVASVHHLRLLSSWWAVS
jgi:uncharacterized membrane-anchored protein